MRKSNKDTSNLIIHIKRPDSTPSLQKRFKDCNIEEIP
uniref:Uncharacterized protein n=1 Tax=Lepeophtheirus salmonis TaxID=72036 RepID=A0A0K2UU58_LEPSM